MCIRDSSDTPVALDAWVASVARCSSPQLRDVIRLAWMPNACATGAARCATQTANTNGKPVHDFQASPRSYANGYDGRPETRVESMTWGRASPRSTRAASPITSRASCGSRSNDAMSDISASPATKSGRACQTFSNSSSTSATLVIELLLTMTRLPSSSSAAERENSMTLRTGPSQEIARSGSRRYRLASRAYSTADTTLISSVPSAMRRLSALGTPVTILPPSGTTPRSIAPYTG